MVSVLLATFLTSGIVRHQHAIAAPITPSMMLKSNNVFVDPNSLTLMPTETVFLVLPLENGTLIH
jgi:hypothetical protein